MPINPFSFSNLCLLLISAGLLVYFLWLWRKARQQASPVERQLFGPPVVKFAVAYLSYFILVSVLAANGFFTVVTLPPRFLVIFLPLAFIIVLFCRAKHTGALYFLKVLPPVFFICVQVYRLLIELVFIQFEKEKIIPTALSIHGRNLDLWIGVLALPVAYLFHRQHRWAKKAGLLFNALGLLSLANIFAIAIPSMPSPFRVYPMLYLPTYFPGILIVFLASAAIFLHILSWRQLLSLRQALPAPGEPTSPKRPALFSA